MKMEAYKAHNGTFIVHAREECVPPCPFHAPSPHAMVEEPIVIRQDKGYLVERQCVHGVGHPDPDCLVYFEKHHAGPWGAHGCDGCCTKLGPPP